MIPYDVDPSLHPTQPTPARFEDGFEPPPRTAEHLDGDSARGRTPAALEEKSLF